MPQVGDVLVAFRANASQFQAEAKKVHTSFEQIRADIKQAQADFRAGAISSRDYATALNVARQQAMGLRVAGAATGKGLNQFAGIMAATQTRSLAAAKGIGTVRSSLASLAAMSLGVKGTLGTFTSALLFMSAGNLAAIGIIGGIAAVAKGIELFSRKAKEAAERARELADAWALRMNPALREQQQLIQITQDLAEAQERFNKARAAQVTGPLFIPGVPSQSQAQLNEVAFAALTNLLRVRNAAREAAAALDDVARPLAQVLAAFPRFDFSNLRIPEAPQFIHPQQDERLFGQFMDRRSQMLERARQRTRDLRRSFGLDDRDEEFRAEVDRVGERMGRIFSRALSRGIFEGRFSVIRVLVSVFEAAIQTVIDRIGSNLGKKLANLIANKASGGIFDFIFGSAASPQIGSSGDPKIAGGPTFNINVGPARDPITLARDAQWQMALRESLRVAGSQGYR